MRCDAVSKCCSRTGFPLMVSKADSIHSLQGLTVGAKNAIKRMRLHQWDKDSESKWPGILYVAFSRVENPEDLMLDFDMSAEDLASVGTTDSWRKQHEEVERLTAKAFQRRQELSDMGIGTVQDLIDQTSWVCDKAEEKLTSQTNVPTNVASEIRACISQWRQSMLLILNER